MQETNFQIAAIKINELVISQPAKVTKIIMFVRPRDLDLKMKLSHGE